MAGQCRNASQQTIESFIQNSSHNLSIEDYSTNPFEQRNDDTGHGHPMSPPDLYQNEALNSDLDDATYLDDDFSKIPSYAAYPAEPEIDYQHEIKEEDVEENNVASATPRTYGGITEYERAPAPAFERERKNAPLPNNSESEHRRQKYVLILAKALLHFGAPAHRVEEHLVAASEMMNLKGEFVHLPGAVIATFPMSTEHSAEVYFVRAEGHVSLSYLHRVQVITRQVLHDKKTAQQGCHELHSLIKSDPRYPQYLRAIFAFICSACISPLEFGGSIVDMAVAGSLSAILKVISIKSQHSEGVQTVYEIAIALVISVISRAISTTADPYFCYNAVSSAAIIFILPGFTLLISAMELTSENVLCGSVRLVYAMIYTLFLGFSLTIGSEGYLGFNTASQQRLVNSATTVANPRDYNATWSSADLDSIMSFSGSWTLMETAEHSKNVVEGCFRNPGWGWWRMPLPWWSPFILVPIFSMAKSLSNLQTWKSSHFVVMTVISCATYAMTVLVKSYFSDRADVVSFFGAAVVGFFASVWSRIIRGNGFTSAVTGVLFLVPVALAGDNGLNPTEKDNMRQSGVELALRMIQVAVGVTVGLYASQGLVYLFGDRKSTGRFTF